MKRMIESIENVIQMDKGVIDVLVSHCRQKEVRKKTLLISPLVKDENVYILEKGIARSYNIIDGKEVTSWFSQEGDLTFSTNSFYGKTEGYESERVQCLEDSLLNYIKISDLERLCNQYHRHSQLVKTVASKGFCRNGKTTDISSVYVR